MIAAIEVWDSFGQMLWAILVLVMVIIWLIVPFILMAGNREAKRTNENLAALLQQVDYLAKAKDAELRARKQPASR